MRKIELSYRLSTERERAAHLHNSLMELLHAVRESGSISAAARKLGLSYRHVWGQLREWEKTLGQELINWDRGQRATLSVFGNKLLWTEQLAQARLGPKIEALRAELERTLALAFEPDSHVLNLYASHDEALPLLQDHAATHGLHLDIQFCGSVDAIRALNEGRCVLAGFHAPDHPNPMSLAAQSYRPLLTPGQHKLIGFAERTQGLIVARGNPLRLDNLGRVSVRRARFVNRQTGSGTRVLLDSLLAEAAMTPQMLIGYDRTEPSHAAVAQAVASGSADAGLGTEASARALGLDFVPLLRERYHLVCLKSVLEQPAVQALCRVLEEPAWLAMLDALPGYTAAHCGHVESLRSVLPWWSFPTARGL